MCSPTGPLATLGKPIWFWVSGRSISSCRHTSKLRGGCKQGDRLEQCEVREDFLCAWSWAELPSWLFFLLPVYSWDLEFLSLSLASKPRAEIIFICITHIFSKLSSGFGWRLKGPGLLGERVEGHGFPSCPDCTSLMNYLDYHSKVLCICELLPSGKNSVTSGVLLLL